MNFPAILVNCQGSIFESPAGFIKTDDISSDIPTNVLPIPRDLAPTLIRVGSLATFVSAKAHEHIETKNKIAINIFFEIFIFSLLPCNNFYFLLSPQIFLSLFL